MSAFRALLIMVVAVALSGCGFQLRGSFTLPFDTVYIALPTTSELHAQLRRSIEASTRTRVVEDAKGAQAVLTITADTQAKNILSLNTSGRVREFQLVRTVGFRLTDPAGGDWLPPSQISLRRDISFNDAEVLAKESEEALLWRDMQNDLAQQMLRRLSVAKPPA